MRMPARFGALLSVMAVGLGTALPTAQSPVQSCEAEVRPSWCNAVPGDRADGWMPQRRSEVMARNGVVATSQPLAAQAGLDILKRGGNAIDAAVTAAAMLTLVEPMMVGPGGDLFAIIYIAKENKVYALDASGKAPSGQTLARMNELGYRWDPKNWAPGSGMPQRGILTATVPGAVWGWDEVLRRFGTMTFKETLQPAIDYAEEGFPISERIAVEWRLPPSIGPVTDDPRRCCTQRDPDAVATWYVGGRAPVAGQIFRNPGLARTYRILQQQGRDGFYKGEIARAIVDKSAKLGGTMTMDDLASYKGEWATPATANYKGYDVFTLPPPAQTWATNEMLNILEACVPVWAPGQTLATLGPVSPKYWHFVVEAKKLAFQDLYAFNGDPAFSKVPLDRLLSKAHAKSLCSRVNPARASSPAPGTNADTGGDTIVLSTADRDGNMVAWVNSLYSIFGSGVTVPGYGISLHNRGGLFTLDPKSPNAIAPQKRPFNTLSAGFVMRNDRPLMTVTLMGGDMQAQGIAQVLLNVLDLGANLQAASDMARFRHVQVPNVLTMESPLAARVGSALRAMGHVVEPVNGENMGGYQAIMVTPDRVYRAGSDHRKDGAAVGY
ncbi:MAG TPA: gamma-glutamyltransferase family protein [Vicinamibacterales bacterium]|jgi:gamma-glutamyltranspeptidase / glutathione hydrolase|nr:gamma-glutamyltransferase family protein [Vicinamibacterales bacterium]